MNSKMSALPKQTYGFALPLSKTTIASLPDELTVRILKEADLPPAKIIKLRSFNRQFWRVCSDNELWRTLVAPRLRDPAGKEHKKAEPSLYYSLCSMPKDVQAY